MNFNGSKEYAAKADAASFEGTSGLSFSSLFELTKPRLSMLSVFTAALGYLAHHPLNKEALTFWSLMLGTSLSRTRHGDGPASRTKTQCLVALT